MVTALLMSGVLDFSFLTLRVDFFSSLLFFSFLSTVGETLSGDLLVLFLMALGEWDSDKLTGVIFAFLGSDLDGPRLLNILISFLFFSGESSFFRPSRTTAFFSAALRP